MSAVRDSSQNTTFIFSNFYSIYRKGKIELESKNELAKGLILKSSSRTQNPLEAKVSAVSNIQTEELSSWSHCEVQASKREVANHLRTLRDARKRLDFLMQEIDTLLK